MVAPDTGEEMGFEDLLPTTYIHVVMWEADLGLAV